ncbi:MAG TPA: YchJ family metal-binding protein [Candidatus Obscuribacter sp.]|nr:YchJ family metal-binding protein [Candidatus Obscuribacter sp.]HMY55389.1 YchJ family metal-binding protein [Candidatus Obscuribacter sp.]HNB16434.1 YchJ family metal-binding protein [Candidatus Obscuribacter sp.]HND67070.1 YchJ family metal-binding protein [Candidatus Obscuribacter sp.]HNG21066.1 YchJ family metal-binding protein [Candidatus Obscuribacter sp.]
MPDSKELDKKRRYEACACASGKLYGRCCAPYHGGQPAPTALTLMRSRFSAYALGLCSYIVSTTHKESPLREANLEAWITSIGRFCAATKFDGLKILEEASDAKDAAVAFVTFRAYLRQKENDAGFTERSRFLYEDGKWYYFSGDCLDSIGLDSIGKV